MTHHWDYLLEQAILRHQLTKYPAMKFSIRRLNLFLNASFSRPAFSVAPRAVEILGTFYDVLGQRYRLKMDDLQSSGGGSFGDVKLTIDALSGRARVELTPTNLSVDWINLISAEEDVKAAKDYMQACEDVVQGFLADNTISGRLFKASMWLDCEGGENAASSFLEEKGIRAFPFASDYAAYRKEYTLQLTMMSEEQGRRMSFAVQPSYIGEGQLFVQTEFAFVALFEKMAGLVDQFDEARNQLEKLLNEAGLETESRSGDASA